MKSGASESNYYYLNEHYQFPDDVFVSHLPQEVVQSTARIKILWCQHAYDQPHYVNFDHNTCDAMVCPSEWTKQGFIKYHKVPEDKLVVIWNGVGPQFTYSPQKTKTLIHTSIPYKGLELLPYIFPIVKKAHPDCELKIFSSMGLYGQEQDPYEQLYQHLKTMPGVHYSPAVDQAALIEHLQSAAVFVHPNIWEEGFCVSMAEAMAAGCYPIVADIGALAEISGEIATLVPMDGESTTKGWQVTDQFINMFAQAVIDALNFYDKDRKYYDEISLRCSKYSRNRYDWGTIAEQWKKLIRNLNEKVRR